VSQLRVANGHALQHMRQHPVHVHLVRGGQRPAAVRCANI